MVTETGLGPPALLAAPRKRMYRKSFTNGGSRIDDHSTDRHGRDGVENATLLLMMQRNPTWLVEVSTGSAWRAAGR